MLVYRTGTGSPACEPFYDLAAARLPGAGSTGLIFAGFCSPDLTVAVSFDAAATGTQRFTGRLLPRPPSSDFVTFAVTLAGAAVPVLHAEVFETYLPGPGDVIDHTEVALTWSDELGFHSSTALEPLRGQLQVQSLGAALGPRGVPVLALTLKGPRRPRASCRPISM